MMTTNKLTKTFASGSLAIGVLAGAVLTATSASATTPFPDGSVTLTWAEWVAGKHLVLGPEGSPQATASYVGGGTFDPLEDNDETSCINPKTNDRNNNGRDFQLIIY